MTIHSSISKKQWAGMPYHPISVEYKNRFGDRTIKIPVTIAEDCPNRRGLKGMKTCLFCDAWGTAAFSETTHLSLKQQIETLRQKCKTQFNIHQFIVYFQSYTNTFLGIKQQRKNFDLALTYPDVKGLVIATRPDCLSPMVFDLWNEYSKKTFLAVELGVQSFNEDELLFYRRGHTAEQSIKAICQIKDKTDVNLGIHLIFGTPQETDNSLVETAQQINALPIDNVKLHNLHVLKNTPLENLFRTGKFKPISLKEYARRVALFLDHLNPDISVHRLSALSSRWDELVAPLWNRYKRKTHQAIIDVMQSKGSFQGRLCQKQ